MLKNNKGFSLIELMVVVAIIAILSMIAVPSYQGFQAKARQKEGFALLSAYYTSAQATKAEVGYFTGDFVSTGFQPTGRLGYRITAADGADPQYGTFSNNCIRTNQPCACQPNACNPTFVTWTEINAAANGGIGVGTPQNCTAAVTNTTFLACASGRIKNNNGERDTYSIDQNKNLVMRQDGLN